MALSITRAARGDALADALAQRLRTPLPDPLATEQVVVHSRGMERWISQHLSRTLGAARGGDGICANVAFPFPEQVVRSAIRAAGGPDPRRSPWAPDRLVWPLLQLVDEGLGLWAAPLRDRIAADPPGRFTILRGVADQLDSAAVHRPDLVLRWLAGDDVDAAGHPLGRGDRWQPQLLRVLRDRLAQPTLAESVIDVVAGMRAPADLPPRISVFGFTALPAAHLAVLVALADVIDVDLYLLHPSPALWDRCEGIRGTVGDDGLPVTPLRDRADLPAPTNRLLRSWGRDSHEMQAVVQTIAPGMSTGATRADLGDAVVADGLLGALQSAIRDDTDPTPGSAEVDRTVQVHACHGRTRQVQVLRDEILRLMADDPTLHPRDIVVMCPDVEEFAPLVRAHLAVPAGDPDGRPDLRVRLADRSLRQVNPMLRTIDDLLGLAAGRVTLTGLLDLAAAAPVRRRFALSDDDLDQLGSWAADAGIRWGLDTDDRAHHGVSLADGTVLRGTTRMLLGAAMADEDLRTVAGITPLDTVEGADVMLVGRFTELTARLRTALTALRTDQPIAAWVDALTGAADRLMLAPRDEPWQRTQLTELLAEVLTAAQAGTGEPPDVAIDLTEVRALLGDQLRGRPSWANHRTGDLTVCTLVPMRTVPHRVICLLGMDDEVFPRRPHPSGDDLIARHPRIGDRDTRTEDRQLLLDAVLAARDAVIVTYAGVDPRTGEDRPPCVPVAELVRTIQRMTGDGAPVVTTHPLHAHDPLAFTAARPGFDPQAHGGARVVASRAVIPPDRDEMTAEPLSIIPPAEVALDRLIAFARNPVGHFYRQTVGAYVPDDPEPVDEQVPLTLAPLTFWGLGEALLRHDAAAEPDRVVAAIRGRGQLPPAALGTKQIDKVTAGAVDISDLADAHGLPLNPTGFRQVDVHLDGRRVHGTVGSLDGVRHISTGYSKVRGKGIISAWVNLLALTLDDPDTPWEAVVLGRHERDKVEGRNRAHGVRIGALGDNAEDRHETAAGLLADLLALHDDALAEPLVVPASSASAYAMERVVRGLPASAADDKAAERWDHDDHRPGADADLPAHLLLFGDAVPYDVLRAERPRAVDVQPGHDPEPHRFGALAVRLWAPVLTRCKAVRG